MESLDDENRRALLRRLKEKMPARSENEAKAMHNLALAQMRAEQLREVRPL